MATGDGAPGTGPLGSGEWKAGEVIAEWMFAEVNGVGPPASFQQEDSQRQTHTSAGASSPAASDLIFCRCSSRRILLEPRRKSHENGFSSPAPSLNRRLCRQTMAPLSPPLCRRIPEGPRTRDSPMLASRVLLEWPGRCPGHGRQRGDVPSTLALVPLELTKPGSPPPFPKIRLLPRVPPAVPSQ